MPSNRSPKAMSEPLEYAAFTRDGAGGNGAGVVLDASGMSDDEQLAVAARLGHPETAFLVPDGTDRIRLRYFSPVAEVAFCGHATIATAIALAERDGAGPRRFATPAGEIDVDVRVESGSLVAEFASVAASSAPIDAVLLDTLLAALRWDRGDLHPDWPAHLAFTGNRHPVLVTATRERLATLDYDYPALLRAMTDAGLVTVQLVHPIGADVFAARNPFPIGGVVEDPATGSAAAALGAYLRTLSPHLGERRIRIEQGVEIGRPSELLVRLVPGDERVHVAGRATRLDAGRLPALAPLAAAPVG